MIHRGKRALEQSLFQVDRNYYVATSTDLFSSAPLDASIETEILIIGGGLAGLATGLGLIERGAKDVTIIESETVGFGASGRNGGFVFGGYSLGESDLLKQLGDHNGRWAYGLTTAAVELIRSRIERYTIACDKQETGVVLADWFRSPNALQSKQQWMSDKLDIHWQWLGQEQLQRYVVSNRYHQGLLEPNAFHMHPLKYVKGLANAFVNCGGRCYEKSRALSITQPTTSKQDFVEVLTDRGKIVAKQCIIACGGYIGSFFPPIARATLPISTYIMVTEPLGERIKQLIPQQCAIYDTRFAFDYYRPLPDTRLLWGGRISVRARDSSAVVKLLRRDMIRVFPSLKRAAIDYAWGGLMGYPLHKMPLIGRTHPRIWHVTGFGGHGVAPTTAGGELIAQALMSEREGESVFHLNRFSHFRPRHVFGPLGLIGAQSTYWALQAMDWVRERLE